jgi:AcrR family transcriptional regulator
MELSSQERRIKEKENRRNSILKSARKLFFDKGFKSVTVDKIAAKAGVSKGSVYLYFNSKEEIYAAILIADNIEFNKKVAEAFRREAPAAELLLDFGRMYVDYFLGDNELFRIFMAFMLQADQMNLPAEQHNHLLKIANDNVHIIAEILQKGVAAGEFSPSINVRQGQNTIWGLLNGIISLYLFTGVPARRSEKIHSMVKDSLNIFIKGIKK